MKKNLWAMVLCLLLFGCGSAVQGVSQTPISAPTVFTYTPTATLDSQNQTITPTVFAPLSLPYLGASIAVWGAYYGSAQVIAIGGQILYEYKLPTAILDVGIDPTEGQRVNTVALQFSTPQSFSVALALTKNYLPADKTQQMQRGNVLYWNSHLLARVFPAYDFLNNTGNVVTPGTCTLALYTSPASTLITHTALTLGQIYLPS